MDALRLSNHRTRTENGAPAYDSTLSATLDAFSQLTRYSWSPEVETLLGKAWAEDPDLTLRIIWNLRSIHDGKAEKEVFYRAFGWLYDDHPRTAISNLHLLVQPVCAKPNSEKGLAHGYWKDLLNILALATVDELSNLSKPSVFLHNHRRVRDPKQRNADANADGNLKIDWKPVVKAKRAVFGVAQQARIVGKLADPKYRALYVAVARLFADRLLSDLSLLLDSQMAETADARNALLREIGLAPKWAPSLRGAHDRRTNITTAISRLIYRGKDKVPALTFPSALNDRPELDAPDAIEVMRSFYRRWVLTPLRAATHVTETLMAARRWTEIKYNRVPSLCMRNNKERFFTHDPKGFEAYLISVEKGTRSISGATLLPHALLAEALNARADTSGGVPGGVGGVLGDILRGVATVRGPERFPELTKHREALAATNARVIEAQWNALVQNLREAGTLENAIAICDVSGSMGSVWGRQDINDPQPILPAVALSLLLARLARAPFNDGFITFSGRPAFVRLDPKKGLSETAEGMAKTDWGMNTDFDAVFTKLLLPLAIQHKVKPEDMIKRVFVFSDMQFDDAASSYPAWGANTTSAINTRNGGTEWETNHERVERRWRKAGYELPEIVYWNLSRYGSTFGVQADRKGVALMSGFSPSMLKVFMGEAEAAEVEGGETDTGDSDEGSVDGETKSVKGKAEIDPLTVMKRALGKASFDALVVVD
ncbi:hypothetical protein B0H16DRAFT_1664680 [Mycena metata]|uniref:Uncharacterized protein n=1 Tax=Mycena metata TaxID=1033252 RepID=A0AAD7IB94_9AGAR|nr:hypothetical protein B0H16DRAFT_1664680 [Mycena metata]